MRWSLTVYGGAPAISQKGEFKFGVKPGGAYKTSAIT